MGVTKKATVVAKTATRKVRLSASEVAFAQSQEFPLSEVAKAKLPKRGRPVGSKNKPKAGKELAKLGGSLSSTGWVPPRPVDWEKLTKQLQEALAAEMKENEALESIIADFKNVVRLDSSFTFWDRLVFLFSGKL